MATLNDREKLNPAYPIGLKVRGAVGNIAVFREMPYGRVCCKYYYPTNPRTGRQQGWRSYMVDAMDNWHGFDNGTKDYYNKLRYPRHMSGLNRYIRLFLLGSPHVEIYWGNLEKSTEDATKLTDWLNQAVLQTSSPTFDNLTTNGLLTLVNATTSDNSVVPDDHLLLGSGIKMYESTESGKEGLMVRRNGDISLLISNSQHTCKVFELEDEEYTVLKTLPAGAYHYYLFSDSAEGTNMSFRIYGYPTGGSLDYAQFQIINADNDLKILVNKAGSDLILSPNDYIKLDGKIKTADDSAGVTETTPSGKQPIFKDGICVGHTA
jgi:hypothetical protein